MPRAGCWTRWFVVVYLSFASAASTTLAAEAVGLTLVPPMAERAFGKYVKVEFEIAVNSTYRNPFDADAVDVSLEIRTPSGKTLVLPAFWHQPYEREVIERGGRRADWVYPVGLAGWRARLAPIEVGSYRASARLKDCTGDIRSEPVEFACQPSDSSGFVRVSSRDPRYLSLSNGRPLLLIGQNLAFVGPTQFVTPAKAEQIFSALHGSGANFLRIWTCCEDWALSIEARKSAWGRSWGWKPPFAPAPDSAESGRRCVQLSGDFASFVNLSTPNPLAVRPATRYVLSGRLRTDGDAPLQISATSLDPGDPVRAERPNTWTQFQREFTTGREQRWIDHIAFRLVGGGTAWLDDLSLREASGGPELLWEAAIRNSIRGYYNPTDCFLLDKLVEDAERCGIYLQLCLITRDLYMKSLEKADSDEYAQAIREAKKLLRYAVARWGYSTHVAAWEYFNEINPNLPTDGFYDELGQYLEQIDIYKHLRATSTWSPSPKDWRHPRLDIAETHHYIRPADKERGHDEVAVVLEKVRLLREHASQKPVLIGEFGLAEDNWQRSPYMKQDEQLVHFHNSQWASALSGACGTAAFWWWELLDPMDAYRHYKPLSEFTADIPLDSGLETSTATVATRQVRVVGLQGKACAYLWLFDPQATWWNQVIEKRSPSPIAGAKLQVPGLEPGAYEILWWDTHQGQVVERLNVTLRDAPLTVDVPRFHHDVACKIVRK